MRYELEVNGRVRQVDVRRAEGRFVITLDGHAWTVDASRVPPYMWSLLIEGLSTEVTVVPIGAGRLSVGIGEAAVAVSVNGRRRRGKVDGGVSPSTGTQQILAPMPGKVVRVLVKAGDSVKARQPVVVIEAMKMENELRAGTDGVVAELPVRDGQSVEAGALLAVIAKD